MSALSLPAEGVRWFFSRRSDSAWLRPLQMVAGAWAILLLIFAGDTAHMAVTWWNSSTFNHCMLILPILAWLVAQRRPELAQLTPQSWWPALLWFGAGAGGWLLGEAAGVALARQAGLIMMLQGSASAILGAQITRGLLFPLFYMFFLVPFGEEFVPALQNLTADMCMALLALVGIPAHIDGIFITTPGGYFRVAEACSGVKFLVAMVALGALISNLCFKSWSRRIAFMALCFAVPIIANGLRAFGTIYIAEHTGIEFAASWDHVFYGWIFFAIVIALVIGAGWRFFDRAAEDAAFDPADLRESGKYRLPVKYALAALAAMAALPMLWSAMVMSRAGDLPAHIDLPQVAGWEVVPYEPSAAWMPHFAGAQHYLFGRYRNVSGEEVDYFAVAYDRQAEGSEIVGYGQGAIAAESHWSWSEDITAPDGARGELIKTAGPVRRDVFSFYHINDVTTGSAIQVKLETMKARLFGGDQRAVGIILSGEYKGKQRPRPAMQKFLNDLGNIDKVADHMLAVR